MTKKRDGLEIMRANNPVDPKDLPGPGSPEVKALVEKVMATPRPIPSGTTAVPKARRPVLAYSLIALLVAGGIWVWVSSITQPNAVSCYQQPSLDADRVAAPRGGPATEEACVPVWEQGHLEHPDVEPGSVPQLVACVNRDGTLAVFPTVDQGICGSLGLDQPDPETQHEADAIRSLEASIADLFSPGTCISMSEAESAIREVLDRSAFSEWTIVVQPEAPGRPCASFGIAPESGEVVLVPVPAPDS